MRLGTSLNHGITCYLETPDAMVIFCDPIKIRSMMFCRCLYLRVSETSKKQSKSTTLGSGSCLFTSIYINYFQLSYTNDYSFMFDYSNCWSIESPSKVMVQTRWRLSSIQFLLETGLPVAVTQSLGARDRRNHRCPSVGGQRPELRFVENAQSHGPSRSMIYP